MAFDLAHIGTLVFVMHLVGIVFACHAVLNTRTSQGAIAWAVSLVSVPYLTLIPYLFLGRSKFAGYIDARRLGNREMRERARQPEWERDQAACTTPAALLGERTVLALTRLSHSRFLPGNDVRLLIDGDEAFRAMLAAIEGARDYVIVQFFIVRDDALGRLLSRTLIDKARQGVRVFFLYDGIGSHALTGRYLDPLKKGGVQVRAFRTRRFINRFQLNFRNHRKIVVVDGERAFVGGLNVGMEYLGRRPPLAPWRDTHLQIDGPIVSNVQFVFIEDWFWATREFPDLARPDHRCAADMHCQVIGMGPADDQETCALFFVEAIHAATQRVWITTPYFIPDEAVFAALRLAVMRGVDVRIMLPARPDHRVVYAASTLYAHEAILAGIHVYRYLPGFLHQKVVLIDDTAAAIGSANLDNRSFRLNFEIMVLTADRAFAASVEAMLLQDFTQAREIAADAFRRSPAWRRIAMHCASLFSPIL